MATQQRALKSVVQTLDSFRACTRPALSRRTWPRVAAAALVVLCLLGGSEVWAEEAARLPAQMKPIPFDQIVTFLFLMLGPIKIIGPFAKATRAADTKLARRIAFRAILFSSFALLLAALVGESFLTKYSVPLPVLALSGGVILFLVALQDILQQFTLPVRSEGTPEAAPTLSVAISPIAFPTIVTPYGTAALIIFIALGPDLKSKMAVGAALLGIMLLNMIVMLLARHILRFMGVFLQILGAVLGVIQVALGLQIILVNLQKVWM